MTEIANNTARPGRGTAAESNPLKEARDRVEQAEALRRQGKLQRAEAICSPIVRRYPDYFAALHTLGLIHADRANHERAIGPLFRAAMVNPRSWTTLTALSGVCLSLGASEMAAQILEQARQISPDDPNVLVTLGEIYRHEREYELARDVLQDATERDPDLESAAVALALCHSYLGDNTEAADVLTRMYQRGIRSLGLLSALVSELPPSMVEADVLAELPKVIRAENENASEFENSVAFVRAAGLDKAGRSAEAWEELRAANRWRFERMQQDLHNLRDRERANLKWLRESRECEAHGEEQQTISLFILGPSRSGKTTLEKLVGRLQGVKRGYENPGVDRALRRAFQDAALLTGSLEHLPPQFYPQLAENYVEELQRRAGSARVFTNTHPMHIHDAGRLAARLPSARFIFVKRNLSDIMLRIYMRRYRTGNAYAYSLETIRSHVVWYHEMMDLVAEKFPDIVRVISYEDMVVDPAGALRVAADLCGVPMSDELLPAIGDDRGCAEPYRELMAAELERSSQ